MRFYCTSTGRIGDLNCEFYCTTLPLFSLVACGNADLRVSQSRTSLVMSWVCDQRSNTDITDPQVANISVSVGICVYMGV